MNDRNQEILRKFVLIVVILLYFTIWHVFRIREPEFSRAVTSGDKEKVLKMLESYPQFIGITRNSRKMWGQWTPLHGAVSAGRLDMVELLLSKGASINGKSGYESPLQTAVSKGYDDIALYLLSKHADPDAYDGVSNTPLHVACDLSKTNIAAKLVECGANVNFANRYGETPLMLAAKRGSLGIAADLFEHGADPKMGDAHTGRTALHYAAQYENVDIIIYLIDKGVAVDIRDNEGCSPLHRAAEHIKTNSLDVLIARGADVDATNHIGATPLYSAIDANWSSSQPFHTYRLLLEHGADVNAVSTKGLTPLSLAVKKEKSRQVIELLESYNRNPKSNVKWRR